MQVSCPITNSTNLTLVKKIESATIIALYDMFNIDTRAIFQDKEYVYRYHSPSCDYSFYYPFSIQGEANLYETLEKYSWYYKEEKWEHLQSSERITATDRILEIGCGQGSFLKSLKNKYGNEPVGLELNQHAVDMATSQGLQVYNDDLSTFSKKNKDAFDVVCFFQVLEHIADPINFVRHALHTLKPGGKLIIAVPNNDAILNNDADNALNYPPHHMGLWTEKSLRSLSVELKIDVEAIQNEPLQSEHVDWYVRLRLKQVFGSALHSILISKTFLPRVIKKQVVRNSAKIKGHTILAVYRK
jgi:SAM-dependent methyltransferase